LTPHINDLAICQVRLVLVQRLIYSLVHHDPLPEVLRCLLGILTLVIRACQLYLFDVAHDELFVVALALHEQCFDPLGIAAVFDPPTALFRRVRSVQNSDQVTGRSEPLAHIVHGRLSSCTTQTLSLFVGEVEETGIGLRCVRAAVVADIEALCSDGQPAEVANN